MALNIFLIFITIVIAALLLTIYLLKNKKETLDEQQLDIARYSLDELLEFVKDKVNEATNINPFNLGLSQEEFERQKRRIAELKDALQKCNTGDVNRKNYIKDFIYELIKTSYGLDDTNIDYIIPFHQPHLLDVRTKFDILLYQYEQQHKSAAMDQMMKDYKLDTVRSDGGFRVLEEDIERIYLDKNPHLLFEDKLWIIVQRIYSQYKGFGVIDQLRDLAIDGISGGVSGLPERLDNEDDEEILMGKMLTSKPDSFNSVWFMYRGKTVHLSFLSFGSENELRRVTQNVYKYNYPGQLSESRPFMINEMADGSRVVAVRPKFAESWAFFIRKFSSSSLTIDQMIVHENNELAIKTMEYLVRGCRIIAVTGAQGSGKTTLLIRLIQYINAALTLRIQETAFELNLRKMYPGRNILSFQETDNIDGQAGMDLQKKTDGSVNIVGEVATDGVAALMIQSAQVASLFTLFSHHAKTARDLVYALRNSLLRSGSFSNEKIAEQQVVSVLEFNIHLDKGYDGTRYVERITEIVPVDTDSELERQIQAVQTAAFSNEKEALVNLAQAAIPYFKQGVQQRQFKEQNVIEFRDNKYVAVHPISKERMEAIKAAMPAEMRESFVSFVKANWGEEAV